MFGNHIVDFLTRRLNLVGQSCANEGKDWKIHGGCAGKPNEPFVSCTVPNVYSIIDIAVHTETGQSTGCQFHAGALPDTYVESMGGVYTFSGATITVAGGCRANFNVSVIDACVNGNKYSPFLHYPLASRLQKSILKIQVTTPPPLDC